MRRAMTWMGLALSAVALLPAGRTTATENVMNLVGMIDYRRRPDFKVGDWVRYKVTGSSLQGAHDDYVVTIIIAGEESFWGDDGFWVETFVERQGLAPGGMATLMSYAIFDDSLPVQRMQLYRRKEISETNADGSPLQTVLRRSPASLKMRTPYDALPVDIDTVGPDTVSSPRGLFQCVKVNMRQGKSSTRDVGDSTEYVEAWDKRVLYYSQKIPITSLVREESENYAQQRKWQIGRSESAPPMHYVDRSIGDARVLDFGSGMKAHFLPASMQKSLPGRRAAGAAPPPATPQGARKKSG